MFYVFATLIAVIGLFVEHDTELLLLFSVFMLCGVITDAANKIARR